MHPRHPAARLCGAALPLTALLLAACGGGGGGDGGGTPPPAANPTLDITGASISEGDSGSQTLSFSLSLSAAAVADIQVDYASADGSATAGSDYTAVAGTLIIPAGDTAAAIDVSVIGDTQVEADESFTLTLSNASSNVTLQTASATGTILDDDSAPPPPVSNSSLNDTGVTACVDAAGTESACDAAGGTPQLPGQDGGSGRDPALNDDSDGRAGFAFTKLDAAGDPLADQGALYPATPWDCVLDQVTGLMWEVKTADGGLRDRNWSYSWHDSAAADIPAPLRQENGGSCFDSANCDSEKFVAAVNAAGLCGHHDWRLPRRGELFSLLDFGSRVTLAIDEGYFPNTRALPYWSASLEPLSLRALAVEFDEGISRAMERDTAYNIRLVRGGF